MFLVTIIRLVKTGLRGVKFLARVNMFTPISFRYTLVDTFLQNASVYEKSKNFCDIWYIEVYAHWSQA